MIQLIDLQFMGSPFAIASFMVESEVGPILIETGPASTFEHLEAGLKKHGYQVSDVGHVLLTHIHLDHAGAAWKFAETGATIYMHPLGRRHLSDPSKLLASATRIYGDQMDTLWGTLKPIPAEQIKCPGHSQPVKIGEHTFKSWHTPGHAVHHIAWQLKNSLFSGDVGGVCIQNGPVVAPCPPPDINLEDWRASIGLMRGLDIDEMWLTHFGKVTNIKSHLTELENRMNDWAEWIYPYYQEGASPADLAHPFQMYVQEQLQSEGVSEELTAIYELANPSTMATAGLLRYWKKKEEK